MSEKGRTMKLDKVSKLALVRATFKEIPWLGTYFDIDEIDRVMFQPFTLDVLTADSGYYPGSAGYFDFFETYREGEAPGLEKKIIIAAKDGSFIGQVGVRVEPEKKHKWNFIIVKWKTTVPAHLVPFQETVEQALARFDPDGKAYFILGLLTEKGKKSLFVTLPSVSDETIKASIKREMNRAVQAVKEELAGPE